MPCLRLLSLAIALISLTACSSTRQTTETNERNGEYGIVELNSAKFEQTPAYIYLFENRISGEGPVNKWSAQITNGQVGNVVSTRKAGPEIFMRIEQALFQSLTGSTLKDARFGKIHFVKADETLIVLKKLSAKDD